MDLNKLSTEEMDALFPEYVKYCEDNKLRCSTGCGTYNTIDRDCEIFGDYHPPMSQCSFKFFEWVSEKEDRNEDII